MITISFLHLKLLPGMLVPVHLPVSLHCALPNAMSFPGTFRQFGNTSGGHSMPN